MAVILRDGDGDDRVDQDLFFPKGGDDGGFQLGRVAAGGREPLLQHGKGEGAVGADANGTTEFGRIIDRDRNQVIRAEGLRREIGVGLRRGALRELRNGRGEGEDD